MEIDVESRERLVRVETKLDTLIDSVSVIKKTQADCPARNSYLANKRVSEAEDQQRERAIKKDSRLFGWTGWALAVVGGISQIIGYYLNWTKVP